MNQWPKKRVSQRIQVAVPVHVGDDEAITRDISLNGIYFLTSRLYHEGEDLNFSFDLEYALPEQPVTLDCQGEVLRVEPLGERYGIAARIKNIKHLH